MTITDAQIAELTKRLTLEEKVRLLTGEDAWSTYAMPSIGLRKMVVSDGPTGVRGAEWDERDPSLSLPSATCLSSTWDRSTLATVGHLSALEARRKGIDVVLGPTINLHRSPLGGRHFEAFSEDPFLTGELAKNYVEGIQNQGVGACPKHYVANDSENDRFNVSAVVDEQTLRELYLVPFESAVSAGAWSIMSAYNKVNGITMTENELLETPLKSEWGFDGAVISDWTAVRSVAPSANASQDWVMPGPITPWSEGLLQAVRSGEVSEEKIDEKIHRWLRIADRVGALENSSKSVAPITDVRKTIRAIAARGAVLVKNDGVLPLSGRESQIALLGSHSAEARIMGGGSATVIPTDPISPLKGLTNNAPSSMRVIQASGMHLNTDLKSYELRDLTGANGQPGFTVEYIGENGQVISTEQRSGNRIISMNPTLCMATKRFSVQGTFKASKDGVYEFGSAAVGPIQIYLDGEKVFDEVVTLEEGLDPAAALLNPPVRTVKHALRAGESVEIKYDALPITLPGFALIGFGYGYYEPRLSDADEWEAALQTAKDSEVAIVIVGTTEQVESEGFDRESLLLPGRQNELVDAVAGINPNTIVVVNSGSPVEMPWSEKVRAVLLVWFPGEEYGNALVDILFGSTEPGGRLPTTWAKNLATAPISSTTPVNGELVYNEGLNIGYRAYARNSIEPAYWMGHGIGYTEWTLDSLEIASHAKAGEAVTLKIGSSNIGARSGENVLQVYLRRKDTKVKRPTHWLAGFTRVSGEAGTSQSTPIELAARAFQHWNNGWQNELGTFEVILAKDASLRGGIIHTITIG